MNQLVQYEFSVKVPHMCGWWGCFPLVNVSPVIPTSKDTHSDLSVHNSGLFISDSVCVSPDKNRGWGRWWGQSIPAVFSWVGFHLRASKKPVHFLSRSHHLDLKTHAHFTAPWEIISVHILNWLQCCIADCNIIIKVQLRFTHRHTHTSITRSRLHLSAQAPIYFQLFCVTRDSSRACFTVTIILSSVYKYCSSCSSNALI